MSSLNSTSVPLASGAVWEGSLESCKNHSCISISLLADTGCKVSIMHLDKLGNIQAGDEWHSVSNTSFYKQVASKSTHFKVRLENESPAENQSTCRLVTKLSNSTPDNLNVQLTYEEDSVLAYLRTVDGNVSSDVDGRLFVHQKPLAPASDAVLMNGMHSGICLPLSVDGDGKLNVNTGSSSSATSNNCLCESSLQTSPVALAPGVGKVLRLSAFNDTAQLRYIRLYDSATTPVYSDLAKCVIAVPHSQSVNIELGWNFNNVLYIVAASEPGRDTAYGAVNADELLVNVVLEQDM